MKSERLTHKIDGHYSTFAAKDEMCGLPEGAYWHDGYWWVAARDYKAALVIAVKYGMKPKTRQRKTIRSDGLTRSQIVGAVRRSDQVKTCPQCGFSTCARAKNYNEPCDGGFL